jgi:hypothetical protein
MGDVINLAARRPSLFYAVFVEHRPDDSLGVRVEGVLQDRGGRERVAEALRRAANQIDPANAWAVEENVR